MSSRPVTHVAKAVIAVVALASLAVATPAQGAGTPLPPNAPLVTEGHGWGHGRGLGQWGAKGQADAGKTWSQIVLSYYKGVTIGTRSADEDIRVLLETSADVLVSSDAAFSVKWIGQGTLASSDTTYRFFRARHDGTNYIVEKAPAYTGPWTLVGKNTVAAQFLPGSAYLQHIEDSGVVRYYRGTIDAMRTGTTSMRSINQLTMRQYLYGAVPREMPATWAAEAVRAQALAARSYATYKKDAARASGHAFDICATTSCQVYLGVAMRSSVGTTTVQQLEHPASTAAVDAVAGRVLLYAGKPILAEYSSSTGGYTAAGTVPYLSPVPDPSDSISPHHDWSTEISADAVEATWPEIGQLVGVTVTERNGFGEWGGRVLKMQLVGTTKTLTISGDTFRSAFSPQGVKSNWFRIATFQGALAVTPPKIPVVSGSFAILQIQMKNTGTASWPVGGAVRIGTPDASRFAGAGWISSTRATAVTANVTAPGKTWVAGGEVARFDVRLNAALVTPRSHVQTFQLVNDDLGIVMAPAFSTTVAVVRPNIGVVRGNVWYVRASSYDKTFAYGKSTDRPVAGDWDGDGIETPGLVRGNVWYLNNTFDGFSDVPPFAYGNTTDRILAGDWDGDGVDTPAVVRGNIWYLNNGFDGGGDVPAFAFGMSSDVPVAGDWDGDGKDTPGLVRGNHWYLNDGFDGIAESSFGYGNSTDQHVVGDWDGDGTDTAGVRRGGIWYLNNGKDGLAEVVFAYGNSSDVPVVGEWRGPPHSTPARVDNAAWNFNTGFDGTADAAVAFGNPTDIPLAGDWDGDGWDSPGVFRTNTWHLNNGFDDTAEHSFGYGNTGDRPVVGDWDGDGIDSPGVVRGNIWYLNDEFGPFANKTFAFGTSNDVPVVGDWDGDGVDTPGVLRGSTWYLNNDFDGIAEIVVTFGDGSATPLAGDWDGDGKDTPALVDGERWMLSNGLDGAIEVDFEFGAGSAFPLAGRWSG